MTLPDGYPHSVNKPYGQPARLVRTLPDGDDFFLDRMGGWCADACGTRLNMGTRVIKRGAFLYLPDHDPKPEVRTCHCGAPIERDVLCERCYEAFYALQFDWRRAVQTEAPRGFGKTNDALPVTPDWVLTRNLLKSRK